MSYTISFHRDANLFHNVKYRSSFAAAAEWTGEVVNIGNFANKNLYCDNTVEVGIGRTSPDIGNYQLATNCNYIKIQWDGKTVIGLITDWDYVNDNNVAVSYSVDAFMSALVSGFINEMNGLCERVNMVPSYMLVNDQAEPFSPSDITVANPDMTQVLNDYVQSYEGVEISADGVSASGTKYVLTISDVAAAYVGISAWHRNPFIINQELKTRSNLSFFGGGTTVHSGGVFVGIPIVFDTANLVQVFIYQLLGGCGFITQLPANGYTGQSAVSHRQYVVDSNSSGGQAYNTERNAAGDPMEAIRFITNDDIFNLYVLPENFCQPSVPSPYGTIRGAKSLGNLHMWSGEDQAKNKLLCYPYYYNRLKTANGDEMNVIPQTHWLNVDVSTVPQFALNLKFVGGDTPRIMACIVGRKNEIVQATDPSFCADWFTVRSYPAVPLNINNAYNQQIQNDVANTRQVSAIHTNKRISAQISNPIKQGYIDKVNGRADNINSAQSGLKQMGTMVGSAIGSYSNQFYGNTLDLFSDEAAADAWNAQRTSEAGNFIDIPSTVVMGNTFMTQYATPAFAAYDCGATDTEMFTFSRYLEEFGAACGCYLNPLTNAGNLMGGNASVQAINGRTFYQYANIQITGVMPIEWKQQIKSLFESGVYLLD